MPSSRASRARAHGPRPARARGSAAAPGPGRPRWGRPPPETRRGARRFQGDASSATGVGPDERAVHRGAALDQHRLEVARRQRAQHGGDQQPARAAPRGPRPPPPQRRGRGPGTAGAPRLVKRRSCARRARRRARRGRAQPRVEHDPNGRDGPRPEAAWSGAGRRPAPCRSRRARRRVPRAARERRAGRRTPSPRPARAAPVAVRRR